MSKVYTVRLTPDGSAVLAGAHEGLFRAELGGDRIDWRQEIGGEAVWLLEGAQNDPGLWYLTTWDRNARTGRLLQWREGSTPVELTEIKSQPRWLTTNPIQGDGDLAYVLLWNNDIVAARADGSRVIPGYPVVLITESLLATADETGNVTLWLGSVDGLLQQTLPAVR